MAAATPIVLRVSTRDLGDACAGGGVPVPPAPAPAPVPAPAPAPAPVPAAPATGPPGVRRGIDWVPPGAIRPRVRANSRTTHRHAAPSRSLARDRVAAT